MERAFLEPVVGTSGGVKFPAGVLYDFPIGTWQQLAQNLGKPLNEITISKEDLAASQVAAFAKKGKLEKAASPERRSRSRL